MIVLPNIARASKLIHEVVLGKTVPSSESLQQRKRGILQKLYFTPT